ncbi:unnamed protein product [Pleuronectes platessa]|uniref:Uncharacterized protein n=1 Tax=Pleuronectes platessa TaxID=8262 RepID=A0A9N7U6U5_PLEPL|nr:unnamed protein product [Pleuronectes platessa]
MCWSLLSEEETSGTGEKASTEQDNVKTVILRARCSFWPDKGNCDEEEEEEQEEQEEEVWCPQLYEVAPGRVNKSLSDLHQLLLICSEVCSVRGEAHQRQIHVSVRGPADMTNIDTVVSHVTPLIPEQRESV